MEKISSFIPLLLMVAALIGSGFAPAQIARFNRDNPLSPDDQQPRLVVQLGHASEGVTATAYSPNGRFILTGSYDKTACLWDAASGRELRRFSGHAEPVNAVAFSPDGRLILTGSGTVENSKDNSARLWDIETGRELRRFEGHTSGILSIAFSAEGNQVLTGGYDKSVRLWDAATGRQLKILTEVRTFVTAVGFVPHGPYVVIGAYLRAASLWDSSTGTQVRTFTPPGPPVPSVTALAVSPDGRTLAVAGEADHITRLWDVQTGRDLQTFQGHTGEVQSVAFSPDGKSLLSGSGEYGETRDYSARLWDVATGKELRRFEGHTSELTSVAFSPDGLYALTGSGDDTARLWNLSTGQEARRFEGYSQSIRAIALSTDNHYLLTGSGDNSARLWDNSSGSVVQVFRARTEGVVTSVAFSPDSRFVLTGSSDGTARLWNTETGQEQRSFTGAALKNAGRFTGTVMAINSVAFSMDGRLIATGSSDQTTRVWDVATGRMMKQLGQPYTLPNEPLPAPPVAVTSIAFSPNGHQVLTARAFDPVVHLWDVTTGKQVQEFRGHVLSVAGFINAVAFSPDGSTALTGASDKTARLWDVATGRQIRSFSSDADNIDAVGFSPDGERILTGGSDGITRLWDTETGDEITRFIGDGEPVSVALTRDARFVVTGALDWTTRFWDVASGKELCRLVSLKDDAWAVVAPDGRFDTNNLEDIKGLHWIMADDPFTALPIEIFMRQYYEPRLLPRLLASDEFSQIPSLASLNRSQPIIDIARIESEPNAPDEVAVTVEVEKAANSGVYDLRLFRDGQLVSYVPRNEQKSTVDVQASQSMEAELYEWRQTREIKLDTTGKATLTFPHIKLPRKVDIKQVGFSAYAFNVDKVKSATQRKSFDIPVQLAPVKGRAYIVAVGVNAYENEDFDLQFAADDARRTAQVLTERVAATAQYDKVISITLVSDYERQNDVRRVTRAQATKENLKTVLELLAGKRTTVPKSMEEIENLNELRLATPNDLVLIMYSSHGYKDNRTGNFYFIPYDTGKGTGKVFTDTVRRHSISSEELSWWLRDVDAGEMVMIVDACHSSAAVAGQDFKPGPMGSRGLGQLSYDKGMRILTATQADNVAWEYPTLKQGILMYALLRDGIEARQADFKPKDKVILLSEWLSYGAARVPRLYQEVQAGTVQNFGLFNKGPEFVTVKRNGNRASGSKALEEISVEQSKVQGVQQPSLFDFNKKERGIVLLR